jgi:Flp pilus assembly protein CpaB
VSRRARAIAFGCAALACAGLAAQVAGGYRSDLRSELGRLRSVLVARARLPPRRPLRPADATRLLEVRRVPERFVPRGTLAAPEQAVGRAPAAAIPPGAYVLASQLRHGADHRHRRQGPSLGAGRRPVEIAVTGADALSTPGGDPSGRRFDVIVTTEPGPGGASGRTYIAAANVRLLALTQAGGGGSALGAAAPGDWHATLALTKRQALRLIQAQNFARQVRLIDH